MLRLGKAAGLDRVPLPGKSLCGSRTLGWMEAGGSPTSVPWIQGRGSCRLGQDWLGLGCVGRGGVASLIGDRLWGWPQMGQASANFKHV